MSALLENEKLIDSRFNVMSYDQFLIDNKEKKFNKLCLTEVINADMMIANFGEESYNKTSEAILASGNEAYKQLGLDKVIHVYAHSYKSFMAVANDDMPDEAFYGLMKAFYEQYELASSNETQLGGISRFVLAFGDDLVNRAKSAFYVHKNSQNNFIVVENEKEDLKLQREENLRIYETLNYAITNDKVVPFYQGIYDNNKKEITRYEALMRIYDQEGNICPPGMFLEASKELKLYLTLSKIMIDKVLKDFEGKESFISMNISLLDIQSIDFQIWFIDRMKKHPTPEKVLVEFVETENYNGNQEMIDFLYKIREVGCRIAVDDFGSGFATYTSIISLKPGIIKIDGGITKNLVKNTEYQLILDSICYMAKLIGSQVVAEFVENEEIQDIVLKNNIDFSQGYLFSKPMPKEELEIK